MFPERTNDLNTFLHMYFTDGAVTLGATNKSAVAHVSLLSPLQSKQKPLRSHFNLRDDVKCSCFFPFPRDLSAANRLHRGNLCHLAN